MDLLGNFTLAPSEVMEHASRVRLSFAWATIILTIPRGSLAAEGTYVVGVSRGALAENILRMLAKLRYQVRLTKSSIAVPIIMVKWAEEK